jgi:uncharacterized protein YybS (DUF2232 family)
MSISRLTSIIIAITLVFISLASFLVLNGTVHAVHNTCPFSMFSSGDCPTQGSLALASHHIDNLLVLTQPVLQAVMVLFLISLLLSILNFKNVFKKAAGLRFAGISFQTKEFLYRAKRKIYRWLRAYNKSDSDISFLSA